jgi:hypothetical protein
LYLAKNELPLGTVQTFSQVLYFKLILVLYLTTETIS